MNLQGQREPTREALQDSGLPVVVRPRDGHAVVVASIFIDDVPAVPRQRPGVRLGLESQVQRVRIYFSL